MRYHPLLFIASTGLFLACSGIESGPAPVTFTVDKIAMDSQIKRLVPALAIEYKAGYLIINNDSGKSTSVTLMCPDEVFNESQEELKHLAYRVSMVLYLNSPKSNIDNNFSVTYIPGPIHVGIKSSASYSFYDLPNETQFPVDNNGHLASWPRHHRRHY